MAFYQALPWHEGEDEIHRLTHVPPTDNPTHPMLSGPLARRVSLSPTIAIGTVDSRDQVWCSLWGGDIPIAQQVARGVIGIRTQVDASFDPVVEALYGGKTDGEVIRDGKMVSGLSIHLEERDRVKLFGKMVAGSLNIDNDPHSNPETTKTVGVSGRTGNAQLVLHITQSLGNCPKYLNKKTIVSHPSTNPRLISNSPTLTVEAIAHIQQADLFFIASRGPEDMDCNYRGGPPGFLRVIQPPAQGAHDTQNSSSSSNSNGEKDSNDTNNSVLVWPEYSGNNLYQTLGNLTHTPEAGICIPNLQTGTVLYLSGTSEILIGAAASQILSKTKLAVRFTITAVRFVSDGLTFRGTPCHDNRDLSSSKPRIDRSITDGMSPYNPKVRYLVSELLQQQQQKSLFSAVTTNKTRIQTVPPDEFRDRTVEAWRAKDQAVTTATLVKKTKLTPTITKYRFRIEHVQSEDLRPLWTPGQYVALDFSDELYAGYSHMRDDDPGSLNDDYIRTFTVASLWDARAVGATRHVEFEIVVRNVGAVTKWLSWQNERSGMTKLGVRGFTGDFRFETLIAGDAAENGGTCSDGNNDNGSSFEKKMMKKRKNVFIAAGIGITPLLGQADLMAGDDLVVLWTLHLRDIGLVEEIVRSLPEVSNMIIFVTGTQNLTDEDENEARLQRIEKDANGKGVKIERRRIMAHDLLAVEGDGRVAVENWYLCTAPKMRTEIQEWLEGRVVVFENFDY